MVEKTTPAKERRNCFRRTSDRRVIEQLRRYRKLYKVGQLITSGIKLEEVFETVMEQTNAILGTERSTVFLYDPHGGQLRSLAATGRGLNEIRISPEDGIAGWVFRHKKAQIINSPYEDPRFFRKIDKSTGFKTRNILCIPLINRNGECIGSLQALNRKSGNFTDEDLLMLESVSHYVSIGLENARLYEELMLMNKAKERVINHLSHELKTPMAILFAVFQRLKKNLPDTGKTNLTKTLNRGMRNLSRLMELQEKIEDILHDRVVPEKKEVLDLVETVLSLVGELEENQDEKSLWLIEALEKRIHEIFSPKEIILEQVRLDTEIGGLCDIARQACHARQIEIKENISGEIYVQSHPSLLEIVVGGLVKNAIENTPDEGGIEVRCARREQGVMVEVRDFGIGISPENQRLIFFGFFHTQDTMVYSSKRPYAFNAGGSGIDLLRIKSLSERFGFKLSFESSRCIHIPDDKDLCPGIISQCEYIRDASECWRSGGSLFRVTF